VDVPDWWEAIILAIASWRVFQLIAYDDIFDQPRRYLTKLGKEWNREGDDIPRDYREKWAMFLTCSYCVGAWIALSWWLFWQIWPQAALIVATPFMLSAAVIAGHKLLSSE